MEIKPEYEFFGREVNFDDIKNVKRVFQPGILSLPYLFNPASLKYAISELCGYGSKDILVYFKDIKNVIVSDDEDKKRQWWEVLQRFGSLVNKYFPAGCEMEYWYSLSGKERPLPEFKEDNPPYQAFVRLFDNAIQGFSCFINQNPNKMVFSSERCNYDAIKPGEGLVHDQKSLWEGKSDVFLESAQILSNAFSEMERRRYKVGVKEMSGARRREVRIIYPERGALVGSLYGSDSVALLIENVSLEEIVKQQIRWRDRALCHSSQGDTAGAFC